MNNDNFKKAQQDYDNQLPPDLKHPCEGCNGNCEDCCFEEEDK